MIKKIEQMRHDEVIETVFGIDSLERFNEVAYAVFVYQYGNCSIYKKFCDLLHRTPATVKQVGEIPFMPVDFFYNHSITCLPGKSGLVFYSSTTTGSVPSRHVLPYTRLYEESFKRCFERFYGDPSQYCILGLLPGYLERSNSSLVYMIKRLMEFSGHKRNGFYLHDLEKLKDKLEELMIFEEKILLIGVSYALLDFAEYSPMRLKNTIVMETGGMKGRRREMVRQELHQVLCEAFYIDRINSEYGMTELLSQAYALEKGDFESPPWMKVMIREINDPFTETKPGKTGVINVIDLANVYSCSFIATQDIGRQDPGNTFRVEGRLDNSEMRGCNLMVD